MNHWPKIKLGEIALVQMGQSPPGESYNTQRIGLPFFQGKAEFGEDYPTVVKWCSEPSRIAERDDILISVRAPVGPTNFAKERCAIGRGLAAIRGEPDKCNQRYLRYYLKRFEVSIAARGVGSTFTAINRNDIEQMELPVPPLAEQERIVKLLDEADELRKLRTQADRLTADLIPALFHEMFGDPIVNPMKWPARKLPELCDEKEGIKAGPFGSSLKKDCYTTEGPRVYGQEQVIAGNFMIGDYHISKEKFAEMSAYAVTEGDVLISLVGTIGKVVIVPEGIEQGIINPRLLRVRPRSTILHPIYLSQVLTSPSVIKYFGSVATGITMGVLNAGLLKQLIVPVPPLPLQKEFADRVTEIRELETRQATSRERLDGLFQSCLHRAFNGEL